MNYTTIYIILLNENTHIIYTLYIYPRTCIYPIGKFKYVFAYVAYRSIYYQKYNIGIDNYTHTPQVIQITIEGMYSSHTGENRKTEKKQN